MEPSDKPAFLRVMNGLAAIRRTTLTPEALDLWWSCLLGWEIADVKTAAIAVLKRCEYMPTPKDFEDLRRAGRETSGEVFATVGKWLQYTPNGYTLKANTPRAIAAAIRAIGGANAYAMSDESKLPFLERRFCQHYDQITGADEIRHKAPQIAYADEGRQLLGFIEEEA